MKEDIIIFDKEYDGESLYDLGRDIIECFEPDFNSKAKIIPQGDEFLEQEFRVVVYYKPKKD